VKDLRKAFETVLGKVGTEGRVVQSNLGEFSPWKNDPQAL